jgi:NADH dehydrogenase
MTPIPSPRLVTVFGGSGFLGRHIVRALAKDGWRIRVAVRRPNLALFLRPMGRVGQIQLVKCNANSDEQVRAALEGADACVNLIGVIAPGGSQSFSAMHVYAAERIARLASAMNAARLVHISALGANAEAEATYYRTKAEGERVVREAFPQASILRPSLVFGPEDDFFNRFGMLARLSPMLPLIGGGHNRAQPVFVGDVALAVSAMLADPATEGRAFEAAGPEVFTFKQLMQIVLRQTRRKRLLVPVPFGLAMVKGFFLGLLPKPLLTMDQVRMMKTDTVAHAGEPGLAALGINPCALEAIVPSYLWRFRRQGQFEAVAS